MVFLILLTKKERFALMLPDQDKHELYDVQRTEPYDYTIHVFSLQSIILLLCHDN